MNNIELIDNYLTNRMSDSERKTFEERLISDSDLKAEVESQKQILEGIKRARVAELKNMLNQVPIEGTPTIHFFSPMRIAAGLVGAAVVSAAIYFYVNNEADLNFNSLSSSVSDSTTKTDLENLTPVQTDSNQLKNESTTQPKTELDKKFNSDKNKTTNSSTSVRPSIDVMDPSSEANENVVKVNPTQSAQQEVTKTSQIEVAIDTSNPKYTFHYKFNQSKLQLYGNFNSDLYEIIDINTDHHALFLFYKEAYYFLDETQTEVTPLEVIKDETLLKKLKEYRIN